MIRMTAPTLELADTATQAIREINHRTRDADAFTGPAELYRLVAELALLVGGLPQLLGQLDQWLHTEHHADRLRTDNRTDPGRAVRDAAAQLADAGDAAHDLTHILASAQQCLAHLGATKPTAPPTKGVSFQPLKGGQYSTAVDRATPVRPGQRLGMLTLQIADQSLTDLAAKAETRWAVYLRDPIWSPDPECGHPRASCIAARWSGRRDHHPAHSASLPVAGQELAS